jgi:hypothetical protein
MKWIFDMSLPGNLPTIQPQGYQSRQQVIDVDVKEWQLSRGNIRPRSAQSDWS